MNKEKIVVTGANGYLGRHVVKQLLDTGYNVIAVDIQTDHIDDRATISNISIFDAKDDIYEQLGRPERLIHLAWRNGFNHASHEHMQDLSSHYCFLKNMMEAGLKSVSVMGSMHEIGYWEGAIDENTPANPMSLYGIAKNTLRQAVTILADKTDTSLKWLRGYYIVGDDKSNHSIFSKLMEKAENGETTFPFTSGKNKYDFIDIHEIAVQIAKASVQDEVTGIINCCSGNPVSLGERVETFIREHGYDIQLDYGAFPDREYDSPAVWGNPGKINTIMSR